MLKLQDICWTAPDGRKVLKDINLELGDNRLIAVTGPNGGGKTTLARLLMGVDKPSSGRIIFNDEDITELDVTERAKRGISFAFQQPVRFKGITVKNLIETAAGNKLDKDSLCVILQKVGLCAKDYLDRDVDATLSGGEIKRIEIASVLARSTKFSIFDEPEAGIDLWSFQNLIGVFEQLRRSRRGTLLVISHQERILQIADEIIVIAEGSVKDRGPGLQMTAKLLAKGCDNINCCNRKELFNE
ncbi:MAG: ABC transporter ATP-binding protein [Candidatus Limivicinus sp.]|jgi:Fe-S cluster assembly ATP-binding protein